MASKHTDSAAIKSGPPEGADVACRKGAEHEMQREVHTATPVSAEERKALFAKSCPDTASPYLKPMELVDEKNGQNGKHTPELGKDPVRKNADAPIGPKSTPDANGGRTETSTSQDGIRDTTKNKFGEIVHSKLTRPDGSSSELQTGPDGTVTTTETQPNGSFTKNVIGADGITVVHHTVDGKGGFTDTTEKPDGSKKVHEQQADGSYTESNYRNGKLESKNSFGADGKPKVDEPLVTDTARKPLASEAAKPPEAVKPAPPEPPKPPEDVVAYAKKLADEEAARALVDHSKDASRLRNEGKLGVAAVTAAAGAAGAALEQPSSALQIAEKFGGALTRSPLAKALGPVLSVAQVAGGIVKEADGDHEGRKDIGRVVVTTAASIAAGVVGAGTGPLDVGIVAGTNIIAGQAYDEVRDGKPITAGEALEKHNSSIFYRIMEPSPDNWAN